MKIKNVLAEMERVLSDTPDISRFDLTERVFGAQLHKTVMGMGSGVRPTQFREDRRRADNSQRTNQTVLVENEKLQEEVTSLRTNQERMQVEFDEARRRAEEEAARRDQEAARRDQEAARRDQEAEESRRQIAFIMERFQQQPPPRPPPPY